jgi:hypothetical protein
MANNFEAVSLESVHLENQEENVQIAINLYFEGWLGGQCLMIDFGVMVVEHSGCRSTQLINNLDVGR